MIYVYNSVNAPNLSKQMPEMHLFQGPAIGFRRTFDDGYLEMVYNRKMSCVTSEFDSAGVPMQRQLKFVSNIYNWGGAVSANGWSAGLSFDFGFCKMKGKRAAKDGFGGFDYTWITTPERFLRFINRILPDANTVWIERDLGRIASFRLYAQMFWFPTDMWSEKSGETIDHWFFGGNGLNYGMHMVQRFNSFGAVLYLKFGGN